MRVQELKFKRTELEQLLSYCKKRNKRIRKTDYNFTR